MLTLSCLGYEVALSSGPKASHYPPPQSLQSKVFFFKRNEGKKALLGYQVASLGLKSSGNLGHLNLAPTCVCRYSSLSHYLIWIPLDICWYSCAVQNYVFSPLSAVCAVYDDALFFQDACLHELLTLFEE